MGATTVSVGMDLSYSRICSLVKANLTKVFLSSYIASAMKVQLICISTRDE